MSDDSQYSGPMAAPTPDSTDAPNPINEGMTALNSPDPSTSTGPDQIQPVQQQATPAPVQQGLNGPGSQDDQEVPRGSGKPSLWRQVLAGALSGLAASGSVDSRGLSGGEGFAKGLGAGANQVLNVQPQMQSAQQSADIQNAFHHAQLAQISREMNLAPQDKHEQYLENAANTYNEMLKSGGAVPLTTPTDFATAQHSYQDATLKNPAMTYSIMPTGRDDEGNFQYSAVQYPNGPTQKDIILTDPDGNKVTVPAGSKSSSVGQLYTNMVSKSLDRDSKESIASGKNATTVQVQGLKGQQAADRAANSPNATMLVGSMSDGTQVAGTASELQAAGVANPYKLPAAEVAKVTTARGLVAPGGTFEHVALDIQNLQKSGDLGAVASRWNDFLTGKLGAGAPESYVRLSTDIGFLQTAIMQAHVGAKGGNEMLEHFKSTVGDPSISDSKTLLARLAASYDYMKHKAMQIPTKKAGN